MLQGIELHASDESQFHDTASPASPSGGCSLSATLQASCIADTRNACENSVAQTQGVSKLKTIKIIASLAVTKEANKRRNFIGHT
jgi:hypothetical protein